MRFIELFDKIGENDKLFPKKCVACGHTYESFPEFLKTTTPVKHSLEDCTDVMRAPHTMQYQNCPCGTTLILTFTKDTYPLLEELWDTLRQEAEETDKPLRIVVGEFREQCNRFILWRHQERQALKERERLEAQEPEAVSLTTRDRSSQEADGKSLLGSLKRGLKRLFGA